GTALKAGGAPGRGRWREGTGTGGDKKGPGGRGGKVAAVRREIRGRSNGPDTPKNRPIDRQKPIIGHGLANGSLKTPRASEGTKIARKVAARIARTKIRICPAAHGRFAFQVA